MPSFARLLSSVVVAAGLLRVHAATYNEATSYIGQDFLNGAFTFFTDPDPTDGRVIYVNQATAAADNLTFATDDVFILRADDTTVLSSSGPGRNSVRLTSVATFSTSAIVLDLAHMPQGCGTWPAFWTFGPNWPLTGEIDIMEGVNNQNFNQGTLHTGPSCTMPSSRDQTGNIANNDCAAADDGNDGCGVEFASNTFGPNFNSAGGGWFAMERTSEFISIWFWPRDSTTVTPDVKDGQSSVNTGNWGTPVANFPTSSTCDLAAEFGAAHNIIINLTFCGVFVNTPSSYTLSHYVNANPGAFSDAFFEINAIRVYE
ncbi:endo-beta-glucanase [Rhodocollybia butyracea]|uniref:Endo-beta-glucanase n=1 Tax=Rhodocollybia butyracea TaxID=206335 RepID=A0A9P5PDH9_9AGAR|nr:endo-beta-glucanase [Rhodocollybia butyracea]